MVARDSPATAEWMHSYAIGVLTDVRPGEAIAGYLREIDATLAPFGGRFLVHGDPPDVREGSWTGDLIVIGFPAADGARRWYDSPAYRRIAPWRAENSRGTIALFPGVGPDHRAADVLTPQRKASTSE